MTDPAHYPDDKMARLVEYVRHVVDYNFNMRNHRMRDDIVSYALYMLVKNMNNHPGQRKMNKSIVRYSVLSAITANGMGKYSNYCRSFWIRHAVLETDTITCNDEGETTSIFDVIPAPIPSRDNARRELVRMSRFLSGRDLKVFGMMMNGDHVCEIADAFGVSHSSASLWVKHIIRTLRKSAKRDYDNTQSAITNLYGGREDSASDENTVDNHHAASHGTGRCRSARGYEPCVGRWRKFTVPGHSRRHDPAVIGTTNDFNRPRVRLDGRDGVTALRDLGLMRKSA